MPQPVIFDMDGLLSHTKRPARRICCRPVTILVCDRAGRQVLFFSRP